MQMQKIMMVVNMLVCSIEAEDITIYKCIIRYLNSFADV